MVENAILLNLKTPAPKKGISLGIEKLKLAMVVRTEPIPKNIAIEIFRLNLDFILPRAGITKKQDS